MWVGLGHESVSYCESMTMFALSWRAQCSHLFLTTSASRCCSRRSAIARRSSLRLAFVLRVWYRAHLFTHPSSVCDKHEPVRLAPRSLLAMGEIHVTWRKVTVLTSRRARSGRSQRGARHDVARACFHQHAFCDVAGAAQPRQASVSRAASQVAPSLTLFFSSEQALVLSSVHSSVQKSRTAGAMSGAILRSTSAVKNGCSCLACVMRGHAAGCPCKDCTSCPTKYLPHGPGCLCGSCA